MGSGNAQDSQNSPNVVIRTNGGTLTIDAANDEVTHYGQVDYADIIAVKSSSYKERGTTSLIKVAKGNVALNGESKVGEIHFAKTGDVFTDNKVTLENGGKLPDLSRDPVGTNLVNDILVCEVVTSGTSEYYWLSGNATIEDQKVLVSNDKAGTNKVAATADNSTAVALANVKTGGSEVSDSGATVTPAADITSLEQLVEVTGAAAAKSFAEIGSKEELLAFRDAWNAGKLAGGQTFKLTANINISDIEWLPFGTWEYPFNGTIDGNNKTITGMKKTQVSVNEGYDVYGASTGYGQAFGFIGISGGGDVEVKDLTLSSVNIQLANSGKNVGAVIGYSPSKDKYTDDGKEWWATTETVGKKVLPDNYGKGTITLNNVSVSGTVNANAHGAGLAGKVYSTGKITITNCVNSANISSGNMCGGLVGYINGPTEIEITGSTNNGNVHNTATSSIQVGYFAVVNTNNAQDKITLKNNINNGRCENISSFNSNYNKPSFLTMSSVSSVVQNSAGKYDFSGNVDNGYLYQIGETNYKGHVIIPASCSGTLDVDGYYADGAVMSSGTVTISKGTFGDISFNYGVVNISGGTFNKVSAKNITVTGGTFSDEISTTNGTVTIEGGTVTKIRVTVAGASYDDITVLTTLSHGLTFVRDGGGNNIYTKVQGEYTLVKVIDNQVEFDSTGWTKLNGSSTTWTSFTL